MTESLTLRNTVDSLSLKSTSPYARIILLLKILFSVLKKEKWTEVDATLRVISQYYYFFIQVEGGWVASIQEYNRAGPGSSLGCANVFFGENS